MLARLREFRVQLALVAAVGLGIRVWAVLAWQRFLPVQGDQVFYTHGARALADGVGFVNPYAWNETHIVIPTALHPPLYSMYLAVFSRLGITSPTGHKLVSCLLGVACIVIVGLVARRLAGDRAGIVAAAIAAVYPNLWVNEGSLAAESLYAVLIGVVLWAAYRLWEHPTSWGAVALGAAVALAALTRAEALILFGLLVLPLVALLPAVALGRKVRLLAVAGGVGFLVLVPWVGRNLATFDEPVLMSSGAGYVLEIANCDQTYEGDHLGYWAIECDRDETWIYDTRIEAARHEAEVERTKREAALEYMSDHKSRLPVVIAARVGRMWDVYRPFQGVTFNAFFERRGTLPSQVGLGMYYVLLPLSAVGLIAIRRVGFTIVPFVALAIMVTLTAAVSFGITRYRVPVDVALAVLGGVGTMHLWGRWSGREPAAETAEEPTAPPTLAEVAP